jgi:hypothetical protein
MLLWQETELLQHGSGLIYCGMGGHITKTTTNRTKTTTNDCSGTMGKSKQGDIFAPSCSAVQLGRKDKPWTGVEHQHLFHISALKS